MDSDRYLRRKWVVKTGSTKMIFTKSPREKSEHVYMKIFLWALYLPVYPNMFIERPIDDRYKPDVVSLDIQNMPVFWGESGVVGKDKIRRLTRRYLHTHFAIAKWSTNLDPHVDMIAKAINNLKRSAPVDILRFDAGDAERFIDEAGHVSIQLGDIPHIRLST